MGEQKICEDCYQKQNCQEVYKKLANTKGRSVAFKVVAAFLLPILVFIASLAAFERILAEAIHRNELQTALNFLLALLSAGVCVLIIRAVSHCCENREPEKRLHCGSPPARG